MWSKYIFCFCSLLLALSANAYISREGLGDRQIDRPEQARTGRQVNVSVYEDQIRKIEQSIARLKLERDVEQRDPVRLNDMNFRIEFLQGKLEAAKRGIKNIKHARSSEEVEATQKNVESQLADIQANLYRTMAE